ncbi:hypothetical protein HMP09_3007 [Sphingomonas sp. HMP9]|nr:hypothetical protein HMP09_3007 [Sphingomonas sp. HMP9]
MAIISGVLLAGPSVARMRTFRKRGAIAMVMRAVSSGKLFAATGLKPYLRRINHGAYE